MQRMMGTGPFGRGMFGGGAGGAGAGSAFPAPGVTDQTPADQQQGGQPAGNTAGATGQNPGIPPMNPFAALFNPLGNNTTTPLQTPPPPSAGGPAGGNMANPFMFMNPALFGGVPPQPQAQGQTQTPGSGDQAGGAGGQPQNPFLPPGMDLNQLQNMMQILGMAPGGAGGGGGMAGLGGFGGLPGMGSPPAPADTRPPEERYADQLQQLNEMGFYDFDRNVAALRRSGGSVQGAIEYLLSNP
ncbi:hypothetical protein ABW20_dc0107555 [Dactylellina cionopaga]|nr:hypothetical protein ABW20_dc0107555 [Dactylellina cionopaga]